MNLGSLNARDVSRPMPVTTVVGAVVTASRVLAGPAKLGEGAGFNDVWPYWPFEPSDEFDDPEL